MDMHENAILIASQIILIVIFASVYILVRRPFEQGWVSGRRRISLFILYVYFIAPGLLNSADSPGIFLSGGSLSSKNIVEIVISLVAAIHVAGLAWTTPRFFSVVFSGTRLPIVMMFLVYLVSATWSVYPLFTVFRSVQALVIFLVCLDYLSPQAQELPNWDWWGKRSQKFLLHLCLIGLIQLIYSSILFGVIEDYQLFGIIRNNSLSGAAGFLFIIALHRILVGRSRAWGSLLFAGVLLFVTGSITAIVAALVAGVYAFARGLSTVFLRPAMIVGIVAIALFLVLPQLFDADSPVLSLIASASGRDVDSILEMTGRRNLWTYFIESVSGRLLGGGFASDQSLILPFVWEGVSGFVSAAHSTFVEAWVAAKWLGIVCVVTVFAECWRWALYLPRATKLTVHACILYAIIVAPVISGIGGSNVNVLTAIGFYILSVLPVATRSGVHLAGVTATEFSRG